MGMDAKTAILEQKTALGIELGSTRIKAVLIGADNAPIASGDHEWENRYDNGVWTFFSAISFSPNGRRISSS